MDGTISGANEQRLRAAVGPRADYYLARWRKMDAGGSKASWNWAACFLNVFWFAYRKMWGPMLLLGLVYVASSPLLDPTNRTQLRIVLLSLVALSFVTGAYGNWLYRRQVERLVARSAEAKGGVSLGAAIGAFVGVAVLSMVAGMIPALLAARG